MRFLINLFIKKKSSVAKHKAVSLVELIIVITLIGVLSVGLGFFISQTMDIWSFLSFRTELAHQSRLGLIQMGRNIRQIKPKSETEEPIKEANQNSFYFLKMEGVNEVGLRYTFSENQLIYERDENSNGTFDNSNILLNNLTDFKFIFFDKNDNLTTTISEIYRIRLELTLTEGDQSLSIHYEIYPRNF